MIINNTSQEINKKSNVYGKKYSTYPYTILVQIIKNKT